MALRDRISAAEIELTSLRKSVTPPALMLKRLRSFSPVENKLKLVSLTLEGAEAVAAGDNKVGPYRMPVLLTVEGDYAAIADYLQRLESGDGGLRWRLDLDQSASTKCGAVQ